MQKKLTVTLELKLIVLKVAAPNEPRFLRSFAVFVMIAKKKRKEGKIQHNCHKLINCAVLPF